MFTFESNIKKQPLFFINNKPVFTQFKKEEDKRIPPFKDSTKYLDSDEFREEFNLSRKEAKLIKQSLRSDIVPENNNQLKSKFYSIRKNLNQRLFNEIDLRGTDKTISWKFGEDIKSWPQTSVVIGSSASGKTFLVKSWIEDALKRKKKRNFIYLSPEFNIDQTLKKLRNNKRWQKYFQGIDVSDDTFKEAEQSPAQYWTDVIKPRLLNAGSGSVIILDDNKDSEVYKQTRAFMIKYMRTGRHRGVGLISIQHNIRGGKDTAQAFSSVKTIVLFPRAGGKGKIVDFLHELTGLPLKRAHNIAEIFAESGRWMAINNWSPVVLFGPKYAIWV